jgi:hypothetical protein
VPEIDSERKIKTSGGKAFPSAHEIEAKKIYMNGSAMAEKKVFVRRRIFA